MSEQKKIRTDTDHAVASGAAIETHVRDIYRRHPWLANSVSPGFLQMWVEGMPCGGLAYLNRHPDIVVADLISKRLWEPPRWMFSASFSSAWPIDKVTVSAVAGRPQDDPLTDIVLLSALPNSWKQRWSAAATQPDLEPTVTALVSLIQSELCPVPEDFRALLEGTKGDLTEIARILRKVNDGDHPLAKQAAVMGIRHFYVTFTDDLVRPALQLSGAEAASEERRKLELAVFRRMTGKRTLSALAGLAAEWHRRERDIRFAQLPDLSVTWPPAAEPYTASNGLELVFLTSALELDDEGLKGADSNGVRGLGHCVGSYVPACSAGTAHIMSVRQKTGNSFARLSTADFVLADGEPQLVQHHGYGNSAPPVPAVEAVKEWADKVSRGDLLLNDEVVERAKSGTDLSVVHRARTARERLELALAAWSRFLAPDVRDMSVDEVAEEVLPFADQPAAGLGMRP